MCAVGRESIGRETVHAPVTAPRVASPAMATLHPHALQQHALQGQALQSAAEAPAARGIDADARVRRLCLLAIAAAVLLAAYAGGVAWVTRQVEVSVDRSLQPLPAIVRDRSQP
jgi:hypothetical protein